MPLEPYLKVMVESYFSGSVSGKHGKVHMRPVEGQGYPLNMDVRSPKEMRLLYPVGTRFWINAKLTNRQGGKAFLSTHHSWPYELVEKG